MLPIIFIVLVMALVVWSVIDQHISTRTPTESRPPQKFPRSTICYLVRGPQGNEEIFLGKKVASPKAVKRKIAGKLMSYGGDIEENDVSVKAAQMRELAEESGFRVEAKDLDIVADILVIDENGPRLTLYYLIARSWSGEPSHFEDIENPRWFNARPLPDNILEGDKLILPAVLDGKKLRGSVTYDRDMNIVDQTLIEVSSIE